MPVTAKSPDPEKQNKKKKKREEQTEQNVAWVNEPLSLHAAWLKVVRTRFP